MYLVLFGDRSITDQAIQEVFDANVREYIRRFRSLRPEFIIDPVADIPGFSD